MYATMRSGKARVAIRIPYDYARNLQLGRTASVLVLVDGSDSSVAGTTMDAANGVALEQSLARIPGLTSPPIEVRPSVLYNPSTRSANFFVPGLIAVLLADDDHPADRAEPGARARARHAGAVEDDAHRSRWG